MKRVVSVSLGSKKRDNKVEHEFLGQKFSIERIGTDGDMEKMKELIIDLDGKVDAFGLGGMDLYLVSGKRRYMIKEAEQIVKCAKETPILDGSGLKNTLERRVINEVSKEYNLFTEDTRVLLVCALDRFGMAESISGFGCEMVYGDAIFSLGITLPVKSLDNLDRLARVLFPLVRTLPFKTLYPTGQKQERAESKFEKYYNWAHIIAGDFHYIKKYIPEKLPGKIIITNTVTEEDQEMLKEKEISKVITTTPFINGRAFGTNVMEALLVAYKEEKNELSAEEYDKMLVDLGISPTIIEFNKEKEAAGRGSTYG